MNTVQTNVRVPPGDKPVVRAIAARLRADPRFRDRLKAVLDEDPSPALEARIEWLEEQVRRLLAGKGESGSEPPYRGGGPDMSGSGTRYSAG
jgi:hypothetical protein